MDKNNTLSNAGLAMLRSLEQLYTYCYKELNLPVPPPDQVYAIISRIVTSAWEHLPPSARQYYRTFIQLPAQSNLLALLFALLVLYILFSLLMATVRSLVRVVYGFVRFCLMVALIATAATLIHQYYYYGPDTTIRHA